MATKKTKTGSRPKAKAKAKPSSSAKPSQARENIRKLFLAGLGLADETNVKLHQTFNSLVKKGQTKQPHVKKAVADIRKKILARRKEVEKKFSEYVRRSELMKSKDIQEVRKNWEKKFSDYMRQNNLLKSKDLQQLRTKWEKKFSDYVKQSEILKSKEVKTLRKNVEEWQAKAKEWEAKAKEAAKKAMATPVDKKEEKKWTRPTPEPVTQKPVVEREEVPIASSEVSSSAPEIPLSEVNEQTEQN